MATIVSTKTSGVGGLSVTGDASGILQLASADGTTALTIDASQNVGIGTSSPGAKLEVKSAGNAEAKISTDSNAYAYLTLNTWALDRAQLRAEGANPGAGSGTGSGVLSFWTANNSALAERMRIDSSGNVGIGTSSPSNFGKFAVVGSNTGGAIVNYFRNSWTTPTANTQVVLSLDPGGNGYNIRDSQIKATNNGANQTTLEFYTANAATPSERARINASGQFLIGTSINFFGENLTVYNSNASTAPVAFFYNPNASTTGSALIIQTQGASGTTWKLIDGRSAGGAGRFFVYGNGNVQNSNNSYGAISDESVKESIVDATHKLDDLCKVKIRNFNLKNDENKIKQIGVVAQELEQIFPAMVEEVDGLKGVKYSIFVPILVKAIQELKAIIDTQNARIEALEAK